jgi:hypothetical protein
MHLSYGVYAMYFSTQVFNEYFKELEEESIRDNFVIIYELMDEMMDYGYPQTTETKILQQYAFSLIYLFRATCCCGGLGEL